MVYIVNISCFFSFYLFLTFNYYVSAYEYVHVSKRAHWGQKSLLIALGLDLQWL